MILRNKKSKKAIISTKESFELLRFASEIMICTIKKKVTDDHWSWMMPSHLWYPQIFDSSTLFKISCENYDEKVIKSWDFDLKVI